MSQNTKSSPTPTPPTSGSYGAVVAIVMMMIAFALVMVGVLSNRTSVPYTPNATAVVLQPTPTLMTSLPSLQTVSYTTSQVSSGRSSYLGTCSACHGPDGRGITGLGKTLINSEFVDGLTDDELHAFVIVGRSAFDPLNTTKVEMPARGGNPGLTDAMLYNIIAYIRTLNDPTIELVDDGGSQVAAQPTAVRPVGTAAPFVAPNISALVGGGSSATEAGTAEPTTAPTEVPATPLPVTEVAAVSGSNTALVPPADYNLWCAGCHGPGGEGVNGMGPGLVGLTLDHQELLDFMIIGDLEPGSTGFMHLPRGGFPPMDDNQINALVEYMEALNGASSAPADTGSTDTGSTETGSTDAGTSVAVNLVPPADYNLWCAGCHGANGEGVNGMGPGLIGMPADRSALLDFMIVGDLQPGSTGFMHLPRGGFPPMDDNQINALVDYMMALNGASSAPAETGSTDTTTTDTGSTDAGTPVTVSIAPPADYNLWCAGCHGFNGEGVNGMGPGLAEFTMDRQALLDFMIAGDLEPGSTGFMHLPRGGFPPLDDNQINAVVDYMVQFTVK